MDDVSDKQIAAENAQLRARLTATVARTDDDVTDDAMAGGGLLAHT